MRARLAVVIVAVALGLVGCQDRAEREAKAARANAEIYAAKARREAEAERARAEGYAARARAEAEAQASAARRTASRAEAMVAERAGDAADLASAVANRATVERALALGRQAKAELDKVYRTDSDYDLDVTAAGASADHAAKLAALPHVTVGDLTVGYEQLASVSTDGVTRSRHFRATWRRGDRDVIVGYQTSETLDLAGFAALVPRLVPAVERVLD
ncbi:MAG: hypothetical protein IPL61_02990 [Myxococcales bacterium]|nr:hypothetical protein [Myxococcales bacterium]